MTVGRDPDTSLDKKLLPTQPKILVKGEKVSVCKTLEECDTLRIQVTYLVPDPFRSFGWRLL